MTSADAIVLAGGRATRMGGVDKPAIVIGGRSMLDAALAAVAACRRTVVVGPHRPELGPGIRQVREVPPGSGPVAALGAGLSALGADAAPLVVVLAADLPFLTTSTVAELIRHAMESGADAVFAADESGRPQYMIGLWRRAALSAALAQLDALINQPMKALVPTDTVTVTMPGLADCDTVEEVRRARAATRAAQVSLAPSAAASDAEAPERSELASATGAEATEQTPATDATLTSEVTEQRAADGTLRLEGTTATRGVPKSQAAVHATARGLAVGEQPALSLDEARNTLRDSISRLTAYRAGLRAVRGATLAAPLVAACPLPRFDVSAMDGYAVAGDGPWRLRRDIGFAGGQRPVGLLSGEAVRIATGAHVPDGTTSVLRDEFARVAADDTLHRRPETPLRDDIRRCGEDRNPGDLVASAGTPVTAALISAAASVEVTEALVRGPARARIVMTGDEIRSEGPLHMGQTRDSIGPILPDVLSWYGIRATDRVHLRDTPHGFDEVLTAADDCDLLVIIGATGRGAADQLRGALTRAGTRMLVHRLRLRPGGSTVVAELRSGTVVLGLPGNPYAAVAILMALTQAMLVGLTGGALARPLTGPLHNASAIADPVPRIVPARSVRHGGWLGDPQIRTAHLGGLVDCDGVVIVPPAATDGDIVEFLPLRG